MVLVVVLLMKSDERSGAGRGNQRCSSTCRTRLHDHDETKATGTQEVEEASTESEEQETTEDEKDATEQE